MPLWEQYSLVYFAALDLAQDKVSSCFRNLDRLVNSLRQHPSHIARNRILSEVLDDLVQRGERDRVVSFIRSLAPTCDEEKFLYSGVTGRVSFFAA